MMKRLFGLWLVVLSAMAAAQDHPCQEPEYFFMKSASKPELRDAYCSLTQRAESNERSRQITQDGIKKKRELQLDTASDRDLEIREVRAATSCRVAAASVAGALERRFKSKPPSCN
jgi:hypothetical protein